MKCEAIYDWLLQAESPEAPPANLGEHLAVCGKCRARQQRLLRLEREIEAHSSALNHATAKGRLLRSLAQAPEPLSGPVLPAAQTPNPGWRLWTVTAAALAAGILVAMGVAWLVQSSRDGPGSPDAPIAKGSPWPGGPFAKDTPPSENPARERPKPPHRNEPLPDRHDAPAAKSPPVVAERADLVTRCLQPCLRLAGVTRPAERLATLGSLADDLHQETLRAVKASRWEPTPVLGELYGRVLREGIIDLARAAPPASRRELLTPLLAQLDSAKDDASRAAPDKPTAVAKVLQAMARTSGDVRDQLSTLMNTKTTGPAPASTSDRIPLLVSLFCSQDTATKTPEAPYSPPSAAQLVLIHTLVGYNLLLAKEDDPLIKADYCSDVAEHFVDAILQASRAGHADSVARLGKQLGAVMEEGVARNLGRVQLAGANDSQLEEMDQIGQRAAQAFTTLKQTLNDVPEQARTGLQKAIDAPSQGRERAARAPSKNTAEKPSKSDRKVPPGLRNKPLPPGLGKGMPKDKDDSKDKKPNKHPGS